MGVCAADAQVAVIGGGVVGCAVTHALARRGVVALLLEAQAQLATAASSTNSAIMHTGFDARPGELETRLILRAARLREQLPAELGLELWPCGARMVPRDAAEREAVAALVRNARANGVQALLEPDGSLRVPGETVSDPLAFVLALAAAARAGGAQVRTGACVERIERTDSDAIVLSLGDGEELTARAVVNCAGLFADAVAGIAGDRLPGIYPRKGEFLVFDAQQPLEEILLGVPSQMGKGVLVFPTLDRRFVIAGPTAREREDKSDWSVEADARELILERARRIYPPLEGAEPVDAYAGLRPAGRDGANYVIERSRALPGMVHVAAIRSTGLSAAPAIAELVVEMLAQDGLVQPGPARTLRPPRTLAPPPHREPSAEWWRWGARHRAPASAIGCAR